MRFYFMDSSAVVKRYSVEAGSVFVHHLLADPSAILYASRLARIETLCALARKKKEGHLSIQDFAQIRQQFLYEWEFRMRRLNVTEPVWERAASLGETHVLRSLDAIHLATVLDWLPTIPMQKATAVSLVTSDGQLLDAARREGLDVVDPATV